MPAFAIKSLWPLTKQAFAEWSEDKATKLAAALAYYTMLSIAPLLIICMKIAGAVFGDEAASGQITGYLNQSVGQKGAEAAQEMIKHAGQQGAGVFATIVSIVVLLASASGVFGELQDSLNTIWEVKPKSGRGIMGIIKDRFFSVTLVLGTVFLLLVSLVASTVLTGMTHAIGLDKGVLLSALNFVVSLGVITLLFALIFKYLPDAKVQWRDVWMGAIATALLFTIGKSLLGWYLGRASATSVYGAAGSLVAMLIWVYYSAQILFFGAEFTQVYAKSQGRGIQPTENAEKMTEDDRAAEGKPHKEPEHGGEREELSAAAMAARASTSPALHVRRFDVDAPRPRRAASTALAAASFAAGAMVGGAGIFLADRKERQSRAEKLRRETVTLERRLRMMDRLMRRT